MREQRVAFVQRTMRALRAAEEAEADLAATTDPEAKFVKRVVARALRSQFRRLNEMVATMAMETA